MKIPFVPILLATGLILLLQPLSVRAQDYSKIRIVRLSFVEGEVQYRQPGQDWQDAGANLPIEEGFALRTANGFAEVEFEDALAIRLGTNATMEFTGLALQNGGRVTNLTLSQGTAIISAKLKRLDQLSIAAPKLNLRVPREARFRVDIGPDESWVTVRHGKLEVEFASGSSAFLAGGHTVHVDESGSDAPEVAGNPPQDDFDKWVSRREDELNEAESETSSILSTNSYTEGLADLYNYGVWSYIPGYGAGWMPYGVGAGWMPFIDGQWQFLGGLGWNWISAEPWGWFPYHFGSWVNAPGIGWAWLPIGRLSWMPATANWVNVNNQLGWIPKGPPQLAKPTKAQLAALPSTAVLAAQGPSGAMTAASRVSLTQSGVKFEAAPAPLAAYISPSGESPRAAAFAGGSANIKTFVQASTTSSSARVGGAPAMLHGPSGPSLTLRGARFSTAPQAVLAPHAPPAPTFARGAWMGGAREAFGARGESGARMMSVPSGTTMGTVTSSASHTGGASGSSSGHH